MALTKRQLLAQSLAETLQRRGAWVVSPLPLSPDARLRVDCLSSDATALTALLEAMGLDVRFCGAQQQMRPASIIERWWDGRVLRQQRHNGPADVTTLEVDLPRDDTEDRQGSRKLTKSDDAEVKEMLKALGR
jgi:hypothetical protein